MRIAYLHNRMGHFVSDSTEYHITQALRELGHTVLLVPEDSALNVTELPFDILLFHKGGQYIFPIIERLKKKPNVKVVCWYFDKAWDGREHFLDKLRSRGVQMFVTDGDYAATRKDVHVVRQGWGSANSVAGTPQPERWTEKVGFLGSLYGERVAWHGFMQKMFPHELYKNRNNIHGKALCDYVATVPIIVAPAFPSTDQYSSNRVFLTLGAGGFLIHPRLAHIKEDLEDGKHIILYSSLEDMVQKINQFLDVRFEPERQKIAKDGMELVRSELTYKERIKKILSYVQAGR
jgi:hypothetical protein